MRKNLYENVRVSDDDDFIDWVFERMFWTSTQAGKNS
jgi:hypothetical protein